MVSICHCDEKFFCFDDTKFSTLLVSLLADYHWQGY